MKKKIAIFGSTGSIGRTLINIIKSNKSNFSVKLLTSHKNTKVLLEQIKILDVKNIIVTEKKSFLRSPYQRDRDRIVHSTAFRRLKHKTQLIYHINL